MPLALGLIVCPLIVLVAPQLIAPRSLEGKARFYGKHLKSQHVVWRTFVRPVAERWPTIFALPDPGETAARKLRALGTNALPALPNLIEALSDKRDIVAYYTSEALAGLGEDAVPTLARSLSNQNHRVRLGLICALGKIGSSSACRAISGVLGDTNYDVLHAACIMLAAAGARAGETTPKINNLVLALDPRVRFDAAVCLWSVERRIEPVCSVICETLPVLPVDDVLRALAVLAEIGPNCDKAVVATDKLLHSQNEVLVLPAAAALWKVKQDADTILPVLVGILDDEESHVRFRALELLGQIGRTNPKAEAVLEKYRFHPNAEIKQKADAVTDENARLHQK